MNVCYKVQNTTNLHESMDRYHHHQSIRKITCGGPAVILPTSARDWCHNLQAGIGLNPGTQ